MRSIGLPEALIIMVIGFGFYGAVIAAIWQVFQTRRDVKLLRAAVDEIRARLDGGQS